MSKNARAATDRGSPGTGPPDDHEGDATDTPRSTNPGAILIKVVAPLCLAGALLLIAVKVTVDPGWSWALVLAPFTIMGVVFALTASGILGLGAWRRFRGVIEPENLTPPPERLRPPRDAASVGDRILEDHPEILAAICHGFRIKGLATRVLGESASDPWGIHRAAVGAPGEGIEELFQKAHLHTRHMAHEGHKKRGKGPVPSDGTVLKHAVQAFGRCAARTESGRGNPDCTFEHVVAIYGARTPARDRHLKAIAPRVRRLLERQYPQLATAELSDGSAVQYEKWREQATHDREEIERLQREFERAERKLEEAHDRIREARSEADTLRESVEDERARARQTARERQAQVVEELRETLAARTAEHERVASRLEGRIERLERALREQEREQTRLERALFADDEGADPDPVDLSVLNGTRVILVGGDSGRINPIREHMEGHGAQLVHEDREGGTDLVANAHVVAIWIVQVSHPTMYAVRRECRMTGVPCVYWSRSSPESLATLVAEALATGPEDAEAGTELTVP